ncbi:hypothetical protein F441_04440, partial [Phytophthora nicotianae CJ01A1]
IILSTQDEAGVVEVVLLRSKHGVCMTDNEIRILARRVAIEKHGTIPDSFPSKKWSLRFVKRHGAVISRKRSQILNAKRNDISTEKHLRDCHANLQDAMQGQLPGQRGEQDRHGKRSSGGIRRWQRVRQRPKTSAARRLSSSGGEVCAAKASLDNAWTAFQERWNCETGPVFRKTIAAREATHERMAVGLLAARLCELSWAADRHCCY